MRYPPGHREATRTKILAGAVRKLRRKGLAGVGLSSAMRAAGLTVGGFYAHFRSKLALVDAVLRNGLEDGRANWFAALGETTGVELEQNLVRRYLSRQHRDDVDHTCPMPTVVSSLPGGPALLRATFTKHLNLCVDFIAERLNDTDAVERRQRALVILATCVGGMALARSVNDPALSDEILRASRRALLSKESSSR